jgi:hypothetical protein
MPKRYYYPQIDYHSHPAFRDLGVAPRADDEEVGAMVDAIDDALRDFHADLPAGAAGLEAAFDARVGPALSRLRAHLAATLPAGKLARRVDKAFDDVRSELLIESRILHSRKRYVAQLDRRQAQAVHRSLTDAGAHVFHVDPDILQRLRALTAREQASLREKAQRNPTGRVVENFGRYSDVGVLVDRVFRSNGVPEGLSAYVGSNTQFAGLALEYSHDRQTWWRGCYSDLGLPDTRTTYMHYDHGCQNPKAIIALSEVTPENGPTSFIKASTREQRSNFVHFYVKSVELRFYDEYKNETGSNYYRRMFAEEEHRRDFLRLPTALQSCTHFGEDVLDDTPLSQELLAREVRLTSDVGNCVVFDGDYGIHRGSTVQRGERFAFQVIFNIEPDTPMLTALNQRARFLAKRMLGLQR